MFLAFLNQFEHFGGSKVNFCGFTGSHDISTSPTYHDNKDMLVSGKAEASIYEFAVNVSITTGLLALPMA